MASTTLAVTPIYRLGLTGRDKADCAAEAFTFELLGRIAHDLILLSEFQTGTSSLGCHCLYRNRVR
jgi:hypothetical protein